MSVYECRWHVSYGDGQRLQNYTDDLLWVVGKISEDPDARVSEGGARAEDIGPGHPQFRGIEGTIFTRYEKRRDIPHEELRTRLSRDDLRNRMIELVRAKLPARYDSDHQWGPAERKDVLRDADVMRDIERIVDATIPPPVVEDEGEIPDWVFA